LSDSGGKAGEAWSAQNIPQLDFQKGSLLRPQGCMMMFSRVPHSLTSTVGPGSSGSQKKAIGRLLKSWQLWILWHIERQPTDFVEKES